MRKLHNIINVVVVLAAGLCLVVVGCSPQRPGALETQPGPVVAEPNAVEDVVQVEFPPEIERESESSAALALRFVPGRTTTYKATVEAEKSVEWDGDISARPAAFEGGRTGHRTEVMFEQYVRQVDDEGNAILKITITSLKYIVHSRDSVTFDFDSAGQADQDSPFAKLIGLSYGLEMSPKGEVRSVIDMGPARQTLQGNSPEHHTALRLLEESIIKARHEIPALTALPTQEVPLGQRWSRLKSLDFGMMGMKEYERIYTLEGFDTVGKDRIAVVKMNAIPSSVLAQQQHTQQQASALTQMFDSMESYDGGLQLSLTTGEIVASIERLQVTWVAVDPAAAESETATTRPAAVKMGATQLNRLDRIE